MKFESDMKVIHDFAQALESRDGFNVKEG
ncbi:hypothetical protein A2U01_0074416, partial [Trifolium medium]|nr:hypothetical protein [Trifolium medium]